MRCSQSFMILLETWVNEKMPVAVVALIEAAHPAVTTLAAVCTVALSVCALGLVRMAGPPASWWTSLLLVVALGRICRCELVHELDAEVEL